MLRGKCGVTSPRVMNFPEGARREALCARGTCTSSGTRFICARVRVTLDNLGNTLLENIEIKCTSMRFVHLAWFQERGR